MASTRELLEAQAHELRRMRTALMGRADCESGGRRPGAALVTGACLAVLVFAAGPVTELVAPRPDRAWREGDALVVAEETGQQFVVLALEPGAEPLLQGVPNFVSAQLVLGDPNPATFVVPGAQLRTTERGPDLGIEGAPQTLPAPDALVTGAWAVCAGDQRGVEFTLPNGDRVHEDSGSAHVVGDREGGRWLLATDPTGRARRYRLPSSEAASTFADRLGFPAGTVAAAAVVDAGWLHLVERGVDLTLEAFDPLDPGVGLGPHFTGYRSGDLLRTPQGTHLLSGAGPRLLDDFAATLYEVLSGRARRAGEGALPVPAEPAGTPPDWPNGLPVVARSGAGEQGAVCVLLDQESGTAELRSAADPIAPVVGDLAFRAPPGTGALVRTRVGPRTTHWALDARGRRSEVRGADALRSLGWSDVDVPEVPLAWLAVLPEGVPLSVETARADP